MDGHSLAKINGWRQGSVLDDALLKELQNDLPETANSGIWVVISHDCDVTHSSLTKEPWVEAIYGRIVDDNGPDGNLLWGKNSRVLQILDRGRIYEFKALDRATFSRSHLNHHRPANLHFDTETIRRLVAWIALRYSRRGLPDSFNERTRNAARSLRKSLMQDGVHLSAIYLLVSDDELPPEKDYEIIVRTSMRVEDFDDEDKRVAAVRATNAIEAALTGCDGIEVLESELRSEATLSLDDLRLLKRWDYYNDLTLRGETPEAIPPGD